MKWICKCGCISYEIEENYDVEEEQFFALAERLGHTEAECEPTT